MKNIFFLVMLSIYFSGASAQSKVWTLKECIGRALEKNVLLNQQKLSNDLNEINAKQSMHARIPTLSGAASQSYSFGRSIDYSTNQFVDQSFRTNNFSLNSDVTLFNGLQQVNTIRRNKLTYESGLLDIEKANNDLILRVTLAYLQVLFSYELVENAKVAIETSKSQAARTERLVLAGSVPELNLLEIRTTLANNKYTLAFEENQLAIAKVNLMQLMELPMIADFEVERPVLPEPEDQTNIVSSSEELYNVALTTQPQIKSFEIKKRSSLMGIRVARGSKLPRLSLSGSLFTFYSNSNYLYAFTGRTQSMLVGFVDNDPLKPVYSTVGVTEKQNYSFSQQIKDKVGQQISINLNIPILNGRTARSNVERSRVNYKIAEYDELNTKNQLRKSIEQAIVDLRSAINQYQAAKESIISSELSYQNSQKRFAAGLINPTDFLIQQNAFFSSKTNMARAKYDCFFKQKVLEFYQGKPIAF
jgi:outer membrane protein